MRVLRPLVALLLLTSAVTACAGRNLDTVWDTQFDFAGSRTWAWAPKEPETGPNMPYDAIDAAVKGAVEAHLRAAGFTRSDAQPALLLTYYVGVEEVAEIADEAYYGPGWGAYWAYGWDGPAGLNVSQYERGTITLDVLSSDPAVGLVWRGLAHAELLQGMSPQRVEGAVRSALEDILEEFPPLDDR